MKKRGRRAYEALETDLTPMIDICFQLIIFFMLIMSIKQVYGIAIKFPQGGPPPKERKAQQIKPITIWVGPDQYTAGHQILQEGYLKINGEPVGLGSSKEPETATKEREQGMKYLEEKLEYFRTSTKPVYDSVMTVTGEVNSYHGKIVDVVDRGKKAKLKGFNLLPPQVR